MKVESHANLDHAEVLEQELVARARRLVPLLAKNASKSEQDRRAHEENIDAISEAGRFRRMVPKRFGGHQGSIGRISKSPRR